jgi:hypothetical protein
MKLNSSAGLRVALFLSPWHNFYHGSHLLTGLLLLAARGDIQLDIVSAPDSASRFDSISFQMNLERERIHKKIVVDLHDRPDYLPPCWLDCDVIFKRTLKRDVLQGTLGVSEEHLSKFLPFGVNFPCRNTLLMTSWVRHILPKVFTALCAHPGRTVAELPDQCFVLRQVLKTVSLDKFEREHVIPAEQLVFFQPRVRDPTVLPYDGLHDMNEGRVELVRALRDTLGDRFIGGLIPEPYSRSAYGSDVSEIAADQYSYIRNMHRSAICINVHGLYESLSFKFGEYLSASKCIVTHPVAVALPGELMNNHHMVNFGDVNACVAACVRLLKDPDAVVSMSKAAQAYYADWVRPDVHMMRLLNMVL